MQANGSKAIVAVAISQDNSTVACADGSNDHNIHVFNAENGGLIWKEKGDQNPIYDISFSMMPGDSRFNTVGKRHTCFWDHKKKEKKKGINNGQEIGTHLVSCWDTDGNCYSGFQDGKVYLWADRTCQKAFQAHKQGKAVEAIRWDANCLYTGGRDGTVRSWATPGMTPGKTFSCSADYIRAVDCFNGMFLVGSKDGCLAVMSESGDG
jgi:WD40 repeat protein